MTTPATQVVTGVISLDGHWTNPPLLREPNDIDLHTLARFDASVKEATGIELLGAARFDEQTSIERMHLDLFRAWRALNEKNKSAVRLAMVHLAAKAACFLHDFAGGE